jgi:cytochrome c556
VNVNDEGSTERQQKLKEMGAHRILQKLLHSNDPILFDKVKSTLQQFSSSSAAAAAAANSLLSSSNNTSAMI